MSELKESPAEMTGLFVSNFSCPTDERCLPLGKFFLDEILGCDIKVLLNFIHCF